MNSAVSNDRLEVAILLATKDGAEFLPEQLQSFRDQTHRNWSLHVSDDGSSDATLHIVDQFAQNVTQAVTRRAGPCRGFWRNFMSLALDPTIAADAFAFSDQDDVWHADKLERVLDWLAGVPEGMPALYCARTELVDRQGASLGTTQRFSKAARFQNALVENIAGGNTMVFNKAAKKLIEAAGHVEMVAHDWWVYQLVSAAGGVVHYDAAPCLKYRQHGGNAVGSKVGLAALVQRGRSLLPGRRVKANDIHINALRSVRALLAPESVRSLELFAAARDAVLLQRARLLRQSGVYRQGALDNVAMFVDIVFGDLRLAGATSTAVALLAWS